MSTRPDVLNTDNYVSSKMPCIQCHHIPGVDSTWKICGHKHSVVDWFSFSPLDWPDVPPDWTHHHLHELHDDGRLCLPLHLRHCLHQLHPLHRLCLRCLRWRQARAIFKQHQCYLTNDYNASFTWAKSLIQTWFNDAISKDLNGAQIYTCNVCM